MSCARAYGGILEDVDGNRLIDLGSGIAVTTIGNSSPRVVDAVREQAPYPLYGTIPLMWANREGSWRTHRDVFLRTYRNTC